MASNRELQLEAELKIMGYAYQEAILTQKKLIARIIDLEEKLTPQKRYR